MIDTVASRSFARLFSQRGPQLAWLLGAGTSAAAGVPTGWDMIADFKKRLYCEFTGLPLAEIDVAEPIWLERIDSFFDGANGMPASGDPSEYAVAFEAVFPEAKDRRAYIDEAIRKGNPTFGHRVLAALITQGVLRCVFTTNFDALVERAVVVTDELVPAHQRAHLTVGALDAVDRAVRCARDEAWPLIVKLHGDYQSEQLKNTSTELQEQDARLRHILVDLGARAGLVVAGYSGRDESVMEALEEAVSMPNAMPAGLWWVSKSGHQPLPRVLALLKKATDAGIEAHLVESENFDELMGDIESQFEIEPPLRLHLNSFRARPVVELVTLPVNPAARYPVVRCSALQLLEVPSVAYKIVLDRPVTTRDARQLVRDAGAYGTVSARGSTVAAFGGAHDLERAFEPLRGRVDGIMAIDPISDSGDLGLVYEALARALTRGRPLRPVMRHRGHHLLLREPEAGRDDDTARLARRSLAEVKSAYGGDQLSGVVPGTNWTFAEGVRFRIERWSERWWCVYEPSTWLDAPRLSDDRGAEADRSSQDPARALAMDWVRERWAQRYNPLWNDIIGAWAKLLAPTKETTLSAHYISGTGVNADFRLSWTTAWCSPLVRAGS